MSLWRHVSRGIRAVVRRTVVEREVDEELRQYLEESIADKIARGLPPDAARRAALADLGNPGAARERILTSGWENAVETFSADVRYAVRQLRASPGFALVSLLTLALGIGATTAITSAVAPILFEPLPYPGGHRLVRVTDVGRGGRPADVTFGTYREIADRARSFDSVAVIDQWLPVVTGGGEIERLTGERVSAGFFRTLGVQPALGRDFEAPDGRPGGPNVVIISASLAARRFGGGPDAVGRPIHLNGTAFTVIGVLPSSFDNVLAPAVEVWGPIQYAFPAPFESAQWGHHQQLIGRLRDGVSIDDARREMETVSRNRVSEHPRPPWANLSNGLYVNSLQHDVVVGVRGMLLALAGAVLTLLAIASVNVANLLIARGVRRRSEFAMRAALGASTSRLIRQQLTEGLLLALIGGAFGVLLAYLGVDALVALAPANLPRAGAIGVDRVVLGTTVGLIAIVGLAIGIVPSVMASRGDVAARVQETSTRTTADRRRLRAMLVVAEVALAGMLLVGAGLLLRSLNGLLSTPPGFDASHVLTVRLQLAVNPGNDAASSNLQVFRDTLDAVRALPGVTAAAFTSQLPLSGDFESYGVRFESQTDAAPGGDTAALRYAVTPEYFRALRIPLTRGRLLDARDAPQQPEAVLLNASYARRLFGDRDPVGQRLRIGPEISESNRPWGVVVGVVGDVKQDTLALAAPDAVYVASGQWMWVDDIQSLVVRTTGDAAAVAPEVRRAIASASRNLAVVRSSTMEQIVAASESERRFALIVFETFALAALGLAAIGLYAVLSASVAERRTEMGVRAALGATRRTLLRLVIGRGLALTGIGIAIGLLGAALTARFLGALLYGVSQGDPVTYAGVAALLVGVAVLACGVPALRAATADPLDALRSP